MEVLRTSGLSAISVDIQTDFPDEDFDCLFVDSLGATSFNVAATADADGLVAITLPAAYKKYDGEFEVTLTDSDDEELVSYSVSVLRPYVDPATAAAKLGISLSDATEYEKVARYLIDSKTGGFKRYRRTVQTVGHGLDYLPIRDRITKLYAISENGEALDVALYAISNDQSSIIVAGEEDRTDFKPVWYTRWQTTDFPENWDYEIDADFGWQTIPGSIQEAALLLVQDISCGNNKYLNKLIQEYRTDGYQIKFFDNAWTGTGNAIVDKILSRYAPDIGLRIL